MAFDINTINGFGTGSNGASSGEFGAGYANSYAHVTAVGTNSITIDTATKMDGLFETFTEGTEILFHVSAAADSKSTEYLGRWTLATITAINDNVLTLDTDISQIMPPDSLGAYFCQVVTVAHFTTLTLAEGVTVKPFPYNTTNNYGGIIALKCSEALNFEGGHIDLTAAGIPPASKALRPEFKQETEGGGHGANHAGWENFITRDRLLINCPDGAIFIAAKTVKFNENSRVGNPNDVGTLRKRAGASYSYVQGGSTIFIAADEIVGFTPKLISKKVSKGTNARGFARCFIASNTPLPVDEGLYSFDRFTNPLTPMEIFNVRDFGNGSLGNATDITVQLNNYAKVTAISSDRQKLTYSGKTTGGLTQINRGALVMVHATHKAAGYGIDDTGKFIVATILADDGTDITIDAPAPDVNLADCNVQIVSIPQFDNFTLTKTNNATPKYDGAIGGICAIACKGICDLSGGGIIYVPGGGKAPAYGNAGLKQISNVNMCDRLPIGEGRGSIFLLTKTLTLGDDSRIGGFQSGAKFGGKLTLDDAGNYRGYEGSNYGVNTSLIVAGNGGGGSGGGATVRHPNPSATNVVGGKGGFGSNGSSGYQGAHVLIIADTINNFKQACLSTGGCRGTSATSITISSAAVADYAGYGGAGYGGSGYGYGGNGGFNGGGGGGAGRSARGSGGGSTGWAFIYCNNAVNQDTDATIYDQ